MSASRLKPHVRREPFEAAGKLVELSVNPSVRRFSPLKVSVIR